MHCCPQDTASILLAKLRRVLFSLKRVIFRIHMRRGTFHSSHCLILEQCQFRPRWSGAVLLSPSFVFVNFWIRPNPHLFRGNSAKSFTKGIDAFSNPRKCWSSPFGNILWALITRVIIVWMVIPIRLITLLFLNTLRFLIPWWIKCLYAKWEILDQLAI